ncbi:branched-chain amino acid ABC transporter permease, partial [Actibacterium sp. 188UL27-1]|nr:branched-chain amino acid ABC transporter permease [Actibacterium sp. 188UL27-1]
MRSFASRHPFWAGMLTMLFVVLLWLMFAIWPPELVDVIGKKKVFLSALFNGITLGGLYFLVAS